MINNSEYKTLVSNTIYYYHVRFYGNDFYITHKETKPKSITNGSIFMSIKIATVKVNLQLECGMKRDITYSYNGKLCKQRSRTV